MGRHLPPPGVDTRRHDAYASSRVEGRGFRGVGTTLGVAEHEGQNALSNTSRMGGIPHPVWHKDWEH